MLLSAYGSRLSSRVVQQALNYDVVSSIVSEALNREGISEEFLPKLKLENNKLVYSRSDITPFGDQRTQPSKLYNAANLQWRIEVARKMSRPIEFTNAFDAKLNNLNDVVKNYITAEMKLEKGTDVGYLQAKEVIAKGIQKAVNDQADLFQKGFSVNATHAARVIKVVTRPDKGKVYAMSEWDAWLAERAKLDLRMELLKYAINGSEMYISGKITYLVKWPDGSTTGPEEMEIRGNTATFTK